MADKLIIKDGVLSQGLASIRAATDEFNQAKDESENAANACGHGGLAGALKNAASSWEVRRGKLVTMLQFLGDSMETSIKTFGDVDDRIAEQLRGGHSPSNTSNQSISSNTSGSGGSSTQSPGGSSDSGAGGGSTSQGGGGSVSSDGGANTSGGSAGTPSQGGVAPMSGVEPLADHAPTPMMDSWQQSAPSTDATTSTTGSGSTVDAGVTGVPLSLIGTPAPGTLVDPSLREANVAQLFTTLFQKWTSLGGSNQALVAALTGLGLAGLLTKIGQGTTSTTGTVGQSAGELDPDGAGGASVPSAVGSGSGASSITDVGLPDSMTDEGTDPGAAASGDVSVSAEAASESSSGSADAGSAGTASSSAQSEPVVLPPLDGSTTDASVAVSLAPTAASAPVAPVDLPPLDAPGGGGGGGGTAAPVNLPPLAADTGAPVADPKAASLPPLSSHASAAADGGHAAPTSLPPLTAAGGAAPAMMMGGMAASMGGASMGGSSAAGSQGAGAAASAIVPTTPGGMPAGSAGTVDEDLREQESWRILDEMKTTGAEGDPK